MASTAETKKKKVETKEPVLDEEFFNNPPKEFTIIAKKKGTIGNFKPGVGCLTSKGPVIAVFPNKKEVKVLGEKTYKIKDLDYYSLDFSPELYVPFFTKKIENVETFEQDSDLFYDTILQNFVIPGKKVITFDELKTYFNLIFVKS